MFWTVTDMDAGGPTTKLRNLAGVLILLQLVWTLEVRQVSQVVKVKNSRRGGKKTRYHFN